MNVYAPALIEQGQKVMIGKGFRSKEVIDAIVKHRGVYLTAIGGAAALLAKKRDRKRACSLSEAWNRDDTKAYGRAHAVCRRG